MRNPPSLFLFLLYALSCYAEESFDLPTQFYMSKEGELSNTPPAIFSPKETLLFMPQIPKVNVITGEYCDEECDLMVAGIEPLSINRFYNHLTAINHHLTGHWRVNPETLMLFNFEPVQKSQTFVAVGECNSSLYLYERPIENGFQINPDINKSFTNAASVISGQNHPLNTQVFYDKYTSKRHYSKSRRLPEDHCWWEGKIVDGSGRERIFKTDVKQWPQAGKAWPSSQHQHPLTGEIERSYLDFQGPFQALITEERRPNGNVLKYEYYDINTTPYFNQDLPTTYVLKSITAYSQQGTFLGSIDVYYEGGDHPYLKPSIWYNHITYMGSDGRGAIAFQERRRINGSDRYDSVLTHVQAPGVPVKSYTNRWDRDYYKIPYISQAIVVDRTLLETSYDPHTKKVNAQSAPIGENGQMVPIAWYHYHDNHTEVFDGESNKTIYRFNQDKRITAIEKYQGDHLRVTEKNEWDCSTGNLLKNYFEDGLGHVLRVAEFVYDKNHNAIEHRTRASLEQTKNQHIIYRTFSDDGFNLLLSESDRPGKVIKYNYVPGTNLLESELVYLNNQIAKRTFYFYDNEIGSFCTKTIIDDGHTDQPYDLQGITFRKIVEATPTRLRPCIGLVEEVTEKTIDAAGNEVLLSKIRYAYHPSGKVKREEHYDANDLYRLTIAYEYDANEQLISKIDALGNTINFSYDNQFNLISQYGPRSDMHKEWVYDRANRPIKEIEWQTDGTHLTTAKKYDRMGRVVSLVDVSGFETLYDYDFEGRVMAIHHPNGAYERKEYDSLGNLIQEIDGNGYITKKTYNFRGQPLAIYHPDGTEEHFTYNDCGILATHTNASGIKKVYEYDLFDHPIKVTTYGSDGVLASVITATYSPFRKLSETNEAGETTYYSYDFAGRKIREQKGEKVTEYFYDELNRLHRTRDKDYETQLIMDLNGQLLEKKIVGNKLYFHESYTYDEAGNRTSVTTCEGTTSTLYNSRKDPIEITDPLGNKTHINYTFTGGLVKITTDPKGIKTFAIHDCMGYLTSVQIKNSQDQLLQNRDKKYDLSGNQTHGYEYVYEGPRLKEVILNEWNYGPKGRLERLLEAGQKETRYLYDQANRLKTIIKPDGEQIHREYDHLSRLARYYGRGIDYRYTYDIKSRLTQVEDKIKQSTLKREYDLYDHLIKEKLDNGITLVSQFDPHGTRTALHLPDGSVTTYTYDGPYLHTITRHGLSYTYSERNKAGKPTIATLPDHSQIKITYDPLLRWKSYDSPHFAATYLYDEVGNLTDYSFTDTLGQQTHQYTYDELNQLSSENEHHYTHDSLYNRRSKDQTPYAVNALCQVTSDGQKSYTYDKNGNLLFDGETSYEYDILDRLIAVNRNGARTTFAYDALNRRIAKNYDLYSWDDKKEIGCIRNGKVQELRILGEGLGAEIGAAVMCEFNGTLYLPIHDHRGSLAALFRPKGPVSTYRYTAFGEQTAGDTLTPWRFASKRHDPETGFVYFGRRYYSPPLGRWITADPNGFQDGPNLYAYVKNSPIIGIDLHGLKGLFSWDSFRGGCSATFDYFYDGFCKFGSWMDNHLRTGFDMQWRTISDPIGHGRWLCDKASCFAKQIPQQMNFDSFKSGCKGAATSLFPKTTHALTTKKENLDDYSRAYIHQQAALELATFLASFVIAEATTAERLAATDHLFGLEISQSKNITDAVRSAKEGGKNYGFLKNNLGRTTQELSKGVASLEKQIKLHEEKIANPEKYIKNWHGLDKRQQDALINKKWPSDIQRQTEQRDILRYLIDDID